MAQLSVNMTGTSVFGREWIVKMGNPWCIRKVSYQVPFSTKPGPWLLLKRNHFQRWVNLTADQNFLVNGADHLIH